MLCLTIYCFVNVLDHCPQSGDCENYGIRAKRRTVVKLTVNHGSVHLSFCVVLDDGSWLPSVRRDQVLAFCHCEGLIFVN